jgi:uncharacterized protein
MGNGSEGEGGPAGAIAPVQGTERSRSIDAVRGFALLGILLMNIVAWGMDLRAYDNPTVIGGATGANLWMWTLSHLLVEGKMRALFSMVFGAGIILFTARAEQRGAGAAVGDLYYRRTLWLLAFGIAHVYLLWIGEILYPYALCALALFPFRTLRPKPLLTIAGALMLLALGVDLWSVRHNRAMRDEGLAAIQLEKEGKKLTDDQEAAKEKYEGWLEMVQPGPDDIKKDAEAFGGGFLKVFAYRAGLVWEYAHSGPYYHPGLWDIWAMMLVGMAFFKMGIIDGARLGSFYVRLAVVAYAIGIGVNSFSAWNCIRTKWDPVLRGYFATTYDLGRLAVALGHMSLVILLVRRGTIPWLTSRLAAVGQTAFSNYVLQSVICSTLFYGYGFGLYDKLQRYQLLFVVIPIWIAHLVLSPIWLRYYRFGPLEWCWRSLTYWKRQPFRIKAASPAAVPEAATI